jgi:hypothetical protein
VFSMQQRVCGERTPLPHDPRELSLSIAALMFEHTPRRLGFSERRNVQLPQAYPIQFERRQVEFLIAWL